jgi:hypothetical protein
LANFEFASDGKGGTIVYDPPVSMSYASTPGPATIENSATLESAAVVSEPTTFNGSAGIQSSTFTGAVSDLSAIAFGGQTTLGYSPECSQTGATMSSMNGSHSANIALLSNYMASSFATASNNNGSIMVATEVSQAGNESLLTNSQHT